MRRVALRHERIVPGRGIAQLPFQLDATPLLVAARLGSERDFAMCVLRADFGSLQCIAQLVDLRGQLGVLSGPVGQRSLVLEQQSVIGSHRLFARRESGLQLRAGFELASQALIEIVTRDDDLVDRASALLDACHQLVVLGQLRREAPRQLGRARLLGAQGAVGECERFGVTFIQFLDLSLEPLRVVTQLLLGALRHLLAECAVLGEPRMFGRKRLEARGILIALQLQRVVALQQDRVRVLRRHDVRFEVGDALQNAIDVDRERFDLRTFAVDVDAANFDRRLVRRGVDQLVDVAQRLDSPRVGARQALLLIDECLLVRFNVEHGQHVGTIESVG